jgi:hypothetical protein
MLVALTRDEAEERHRTRQNYSLATRLPGGNLLILHHHTGWMPHHVDPRRNPHYLRAFSLNVYGSMGRLYSHFAEDFERSGVIEMRGAQIYVHSAPPRSISEPVRSLWAVHNHFAAGTKAVYDYRVGPPYDTSRPMTDSDLALCEFADPPFGKFDDFWQRVSTYLENEGFGSFT